MKKYSRVSYEERCQIFVLLQVKKSKPEIARILGRDKSTIYRELRRITAYEPVYKPRFAQS
jgi:IS30 family transposase